MANSLEFSRFGDPIECRFDDYGAPIDEPQPVPVLVADDRPATISVAEIDDFDPFQEPDETDEERRERMLLENPELGIYGYTEDDIPDYDQDEVK